MGYSPEDIDLSEPVDLPGSGGERVFCVDGPNGTELRPFVVRPDGLVPADGPACEMIVEGKATVVKDDLELMIEARKWWSLFCATHMIAAIGFEGEESVMPRQAMEEVVRGRRGNITAKTKKNVVYEAARESGHSGVHIKALDGRRLYLTKEEAAALGLVLLADGRLVEEWIE